MSAPFTPLQEFRSLAPEFEDPGGLYPVPDDRVEVALGRAGRQVNPAKWGSCTNEAIARLAAHELTMQSRANSLGPAAIGVTGAVSSLRTKNEAIAYGSTATNVMKGDEDLSQSSHGLAYLRLRATLPCTQVMYVGAC